MPRRCSEARFLLLLVLTLLVGGCSTRLLYGNAERLVVWQAQDYVRLDRDQRDWLRSRLRMHLAWHRDAQLPEWAAELRDLEAAVRDDALGPARLEAFYARGMGWSRELLREVAPTGATLLASLPASALAELPEAFAESNAELNEDYEGLSPEDQRAVWREKAREGLEDWIGSLDARQELLLDATAARVEPDNRWWIAYRERWQAELLAALERREDRSWFGAAFHTLALHRPAFYTPEYRAVRARNDAAYRDFLVALVASLDDAQRDRLGDRLGALAEDFEVLSDRPEGGAEDPGPFPSG